MARGTLTLALLVTATIGLLSPSFVGRAAAESRVALVIGNGAYEHVPRLPNPVNDASDVGAALKRDGFDTIVATDLNKSAMEEATIRFAKAARDADVAVFYYSGHALQFAGINYLAPTDADLKDETDLRRMVRLDDVVVDLQRAKNLRILVLDSCRDNPLAEQLKRSIGNSRAMPLQRGLAKIDAPQGMIVAYATQAGSTADDGDGRNSPYTTAFLKHIEKQEEIGTIFRRVSSDVYESTQHRQLPELSLSITGEFYLRGKLEIAVPSDNSVQTRPSTEPKFKSEFHGVINPPEAPTYRVIHDNVIARAGPNEDEDGLFRLRQLDEVRGSAEYEKERTYGKVSENEKLERTWVKITAPNGEVGFLQKIHLTTPDRFGRWTKVRDRVGTLTTMFERAEKENSGPYASFYGIYCGGAKPDCLDAPASSPSQMIPLLNVRFLVWFEGNKIHTVNILGAIERVGTMQSDKPLSFDGKAPPFKGIKALPSYKVVYDRGSPETFAFSKTTLFSAKYGDEQFYAMERARSFSFVKQKILSQYMMTAADVYAH
jgi:Caspase domain